VQFQALTDRLSHRISAVLVCKPLSLHIAGFDHLGNALEIIAVEDAERDRLVVIHETEKTVSVFVGRYYKREKALIITQGAHFQKRMTGIREAVAANLREYRRRLGLDSGAVCGKSRGLHPLYRHDRDL
jgi:hypothetical protein